MLPVDAFGRGATFHHIGLAVPSIRACSDALEVFEDPTQQVKVAFFDWNGVHTELIEPAVESSPVSRSLRAGQRLQHVCYEVDSIEAALESGRAAGFHRMGAPVPATAFAGRRIAWVFHAVYGLVELLER